MRRWVPLVLGALLVPASVTAFGFGVYGTELTTALSSSVEVPPAPQVIGPVPVVDFLEPLPREAPAPLVVPAVVAQQKVRELFASHEVKGITFAPGTASLVGRGESVQNALVSLLRPASGSVVTLVAHAWNGETASHRCDVLALERAGLVRDFLTSRGVASTITTRVIVDPVWGPPSDGGPQVDVLVR